MARWDNRDIGMSAVTVEKNSLLDTLRNNRKAHAATYREAVVAYRVAALARLQEIMTDLADTAMPPKPLNWVLPLPEQHLGDYDKAIRMLEQDVKALVELPEEAYDRLIEDHWDWRDRFDANTASYTGPKQ